MSKAKLKLVYRRPYSLSKEECEKMAGWQFERESKKVIHGLQEDANKNLFRQKEELKKRLDRYRVIDLSNPDSWDDQDKEDIYSELGDADYLDIDEFTQLERAEAVIDIRKRLKKELDSIYTQINSKTYKVDYSIIVDFIEIEVIPTEYEGQDK